MRKLSYNDPPSAGASSFFHEEAYPFNDYTPPGQVVEDEQYNVNQSANTGRDGKEFSEFDEFAKKRQNRIKKLKRLKKMKEMLKSKNKSNIFQPTSFYDSMYGSMTGVEGLNAFPLSYIDNIADSPDNVVNPWQSVYQSSATASIQRKTRMEKRAIFWHNYA